MASNCWTLAYTEIVTSLQPAPALEMPPAT
jgi:hypothetical protein